MKFVDLTGEQFGLLRVIGRASSRNGQTRWLCACDCGVETTVYGSNLKAGRSQSCGCENRKKSAERIEARNFIHGDARHGNPARIYRTWRNMKHRCQCENASNYQYYGGRGVTVCAEWQSYKTFKTWALASGYSDLATIDRIDSDRGYEPDNCQWLSASEHACKTWEDRKV